MTIDPRPAVLITGASRGIGRNLSLAFARAGFRVAANYRTGEASASSLRDEILAEGGECEIFQADVADETSSEGLVAAAKDRFGRIDALVNNAGILKDGLATMMSASDFDSVIAVNLRGTFLVARAVLREMVRQRSGRIVNMVSVSGLIGTPGQANYSASKGGVIAMTRSMAKEYGRYGILVNAVAPGFIETEMTTELPAKRVEEAKKMIPLGRFGRADEVAPLTVHLCSGSNTYVSGQILVIDGGLSG